MAATTRLDRVLPSCCVGSLPASSSTDKRNPDEEAVLEHSARIAGMLEKAVPILSGLLLPRDLSFFKEVSYVSKLIQGMLQSLGLQHQSGGEKIPGIYLHPHQSFANLFINLKKTPVISEGTFGRIRKILWLNPPLDTPQIIVKKVMRDAQWIPDFELERDALESFSGTKGIISLIAGGNYSGKYAIFLPFYECNLYKWVKGKPFPISLHEKLKMSGEWLEGLVAIFKKGVHGDLCSKNILLRRGKEGVEGVIADFNCYRSYGNEEPGLTTITVLPPEGWRKFDDNRRWITAQQDVWALGICLYEIFAERRHFFWKFDEKKIARWTSTLRPGWILHFLSEKDAPPFMRALINEMLDPNLRHRLTPLQARKRFSLGYADFCENAQVM